MKDAGGKYYTDEGQLDELHLCINHQCAVLQQTVADRSYCNVYICANNDFIKIPRDGKESKDQVKWLFQSGCPERPFCTAC